MTGQGHIVFLPRHPLRFNVGFLHGQPIGSSRDFHFEYPEVHFEPDFDARQFQAVARVSRTPQGLLVQASAKTEVQAQCVRCLADFTQPLRAEFSELYAFNDRSVSDSGLILPEDGNLDLEPLVREYLLIEIPINPVCRPACKGLCAVCGEDLNIRICEHQSN
jgi:uncharacterized protein